MKLLAHALLLPFLGAFCLASFCFLAFRHWQTEHGPHLATTSYGPHSRLNVAIAKKTFEQYGTEPKWINFQTPNDILLAMTAGELDLGVVQAQILQAPINKASR